MTQHLHSKFKSIPIYLETMPQAQKSKFTNSSLPNKEKVLLLPSYPNRIFATDKDYQKYPSQIILEKLGFDVEYPNSLDK